MKKDADSLDYQKYMQMTDRLMVIPPDMVEECAKDESAVRTAMLQRFQWIKEELEKDDRSS